MEIKNISEKIFRTAPSKSENCSNHTNPFGVNFKGNMINADVFEPAFCGTKETIIQKATNKGRLWASAMVASMNPIKNFGNKIKSSITNAWDVARRTEIQLFPDMENIANKAMGWISDRSIYSGKNLAKRNKEDLTVMLQDEIAIRLLGV